MAQQRNLKHVYFATSDVVVPQPDANDKPDEPSSLGIGSSSTHGNGVGFLRVSPTLPIRIFRPNPFMEIAFDTRTRTPIYVLERLEGPWLLRNENHRHGRKKGRFYEQPLLPVEWRSRNGQYRGSGYDRGHLAPAADFRHLSSESESSIEKDTYMLCNTVPQVPSMNRFAWAQLEAFVRTVAKREWDENNATTHVVTGPLWLPSRKEKPGIFQYSYRGLGEPPTLISVPTHLFKLVAVVRNNVIEKFAAFVMANEEMKKGGGSGQQVDLTQYLVRLSDLEGVSGMHFFAGGDDVDEFRRQADALTEDVWTRASIDRRQTLLLTEGNIRQPEMLKRDMLAHLCQNGTCQ